MSAFSATDKRMMRLALGLGARHLGQTWPNPSVGCVIAKGDRILGCAVTAKGGVPHAEPQALAQAGKAAKGATAYVTLEPCSHHGKTPPCAEALIASGITRLVYAVGDPNPKVAGKGAKMLADAGIVVDHGLCEEQATWQNLGFFKSITQNRPMITLKLATTLDGKIATQSGESQWITGPEARRYTHLLRAQHDAIMVGSGTVHADDPSLTVRRLGDMPNPVRVILDSNLSIPKTSTLVTTSEDTPLWILHGEKAVADLPKTVTLMPAKTSEDGLDLTDALARLAKQGITRLFVEGGAKLAGNLIRHDLVDQIVLMQAGKIIGAEGLSAVGPTGLNLLKDAANFELHQRLELGADIITHWRVVDATGTQKLIVG
ncbi:MAG: bifunctional diaminohydroxyphosphoribosylaminopyrimidine deaminase/5-amino-6-(5-phosphoribosylamino)uracil reductase RibD [Pseudomonadota bacterium]